MKNFLYALVACLFFVGCGYQPIAHQANKAFGGKIFVEVKISLRDPQNSIILKDEISKSIFERLHARVVDKKEATSIIEVELQSVSFISLNTPIKSRKALESLPKKAIIISRLEIPLLLQILQE